MSYGDGDLKAAQDKVRGVFPDAYLYRDDAELDTSERFLIFGGGDVIGAGPTARTAWYDAANTLEVVV